MTNVTSSQGTHGHTGHTGHTGHSPPHGHTGHSPACVKLESDTDDSADTPVKRFKTEHTNTLLLEAPESPSYSFPLAPDYLAPDLTPPSKVPSSPVMVSFNIIILIIQSFLYILTRFNNSAKLMLLHYILYVVNVTMKFYTITK